MSENIRLLLALIQISEDEHYDYFRDCGGASEDFLNGFRACANAIYDKVEHTFRGECDGVLSRKHYVINNQPVSHIVISGGRVFDSYYYRVVRDFLFEYRDWCKKNGVEPTRDVFRTGYDNHRGYDDEEWLKMGDAIFDEVINDVCEE